LAAQLVKDLIEAGIHFGHRASRWNPKMKPYIYGKRNLIHIINIKETLRGILLAKKFLGQVVADGKDVLLVGTKRQARKAVVENAVRTNMHSVSDRWLGGTLTNFKEIRKRVARLDHLEGLEANGLLDQYSKKEGATLRREMRKIQRNLGGIRKMVNFPGVLVVVDQKRELIGIKEARKMGIPVICLLDTDCDPDTVDIPIPGNDDGMRGIDLVIKELTDAVAEGLHMRAAKAVDEQPSEEERRRSRRPAMGRAVETPEAVPAAPEAIPAPADAVPPVSDAPQA
jgi:small subunit ribosomal protein S2